jgi:anti-sigma B factor antagonist
MCGTTARRANALFEVALEGETAVVTPLADLRELRYQEIESGGEQVLAFVSRPPVKNVVIDLGRTRYYGSAALGFFVRLGEATRGRGRMAFCNASALEMEILGVAHLDGVWPIYSSREEALQAVNKGP